MNSASLANRSVPCSDQYIPMCYYRTTSETSACFVCRSLTPVSTQQSLIFADMWVQHSSLHLDEVSGASKYHPSFTWAVSVCERLSVLPRVEHRDTMLEFRTISPSFILRSMSNRSPSSQRFVLTHISLELSASGFSLVPSYFWI